MPVRIGPAAAQRSMTMGWLELGSVRSLRGATGWSVPSAAIPAARPVGCENLIGGGRNRGRGERGRHDKSG